MGTAHGFVGKKCEPLKARFKGVVETVRGPEFLCRPLVGSSRGPCPQYPRHSVFKLQAFGACVLGSRETRYFSKLKPVMQERFAPKPHHALFPPTLQPSTNYSVPRCFPLSLPISFLHVCYLNNFLSLSLRIMRRANEEIHTTLVKQRKETKRVKDEVWKDVYLLQFNHLTNLNYF